MSMILISLALIHDSGTFLGGGMQSVYLETSVIGYLASRPSAEVITAGNQRVTHDWWQNHRQRFELFVSQAVIEECLAGDPVAAGERSVFLDGITVLGITKESRSLAKSLLKIVGLPMKAKIDALHIAIAALNGMDYLLTWNCKHSANPSLRRIIEQVLDDSNLKSPIICTPQEMLYV